MSETTKNIGETLSLTPTKTLTLKRGSVEQGVVRQSFSHGRSKAVVVEKVKRRIPGPGEAKTEAPAADRGAAPKRAGATVKAGAAPAGTPAVAPKASGVVLRTLTEDERNARAHALADARLREHEERERAEEEARVRRTREEVERAECAAAETRKREEEERRKHDEETRRKADEVAKKRFGADALTAKPGARPALEADDDEAPRTARRGTAARPAAAPKPARSGGEKRRGRLTVGAAFSARPVIAMRSPRKKLRVKSRSPRRSRSRSSPTEWPSGRWMSCVSSCSKAIWRRSPTRSTPIPPN